MFVFHLKKAFLKSSLKWIRLYQIHHTSL